MSTIVPTPSVPLMDSRLSAASLYAGKVLYTIPEEATRCTRCQSARMSRLLLPVLTLFLVLVGLATLSCCGSHQWNHPAGLQVGDHKLYLAVILVGVAATGLMGLCLVSSALERKLCFDAEQHQACSDMACTQCAASTHSSTKF
ncbi:hypothetical protein CYLTODRAFT_490157 [Cylindrobasidium torrendii FP15055 ss-10]|uniref:Uncharacterized protein n=1 Tax=Cylindrobasidium torrendii FP15055 ss-10 TaxID=1314674 RepID=A0A0D7BEG5_9AGAR|nr:hypothetical protein CYLTODRAFT_490157 [Cylindrobasidium torrendii FP15055 ss-10]